jgi:hypothetical protein
VNEDDKPAALKRFWDLEGYDHETRHVIYHDDAVLEFPQSGERFEGKANILPWRKQYPAQVELPIRSIRHSGDLWVAENQVRYDGGVWNYGCSLLEFRGDKIITETIYVAPGWDAPDSSDECAMGASQTQVQKLFQTDRRNHHANPHHR